MGMLSFRDRVLNMVRALANLGSCPSWAFTVATTLASRDNASAASRRRSVPAGMSAPLSCHTSTLYPEYVAEKKRKGHERKDKAVWNGPETLKRRALPTRASWS